MNAPANYALTQLHIGDAYYGDRSYTIGNQPAGYENFTAIKTRNGDKNSTNANLLQFTLSQSSTVYVAFDHRATSLPAWLRPAAGFLPIGATVGSNGDSAMGFFDLYKKEYLPGPVILGGNNCCSASGAGSNYIVYIEEGSIAPFAVNPASLSTGAGVVSHISASGGLTPYSAISSDPAVATVLVLGSDIAVTALLPGSTVISVSDSSGSIFPVAVTVTDPCDGIALQQPANYSLTHLSVNAPYYLDRTYTIASLPAGFSSYCALKTRNDDKNINDPNYLRLTASMPVTVYVAYDHRATQLPTWLRTASNFFQRSAEIVAVNGDTSMGYFNVYEKTYPAGQIILGGNACCSSANSGSSYILFIGPAGPLPLQVSPDHLTLLPGGSATALVSGGTPPYSAHSNDSAIAAAVLDNNNLMVTGVEVGGAMIAINDSSNQKVSLSVTVIAPPLRVDPDAVTLVPNEMAGILVSGGSPPYAAVVADSAIAAVAFDLNDSSLLKIMALHGGVTTVTVSDQAGGSATVAVTVIAPLTLNPVNLNLSEGSTGVIAISGGVGPYSAVSGNPAVATVAVSASTLLVTAPAGAVFGTITVTVSDTLGNLATALITVGGIVAGGLEPCPVPPFITGSSTAPNVLLILDHSGSMGGEASRWGTAKRVLKNIIEQFPGVRFGLMRMDGSDYSGNDRISIESVVRQGGKVLKPVGTAGDEIKAYIDAWGTESNKPQTWTNLAETLASAGQYYATVLEGGNRVGKGPAGLGYYEKNYHYNTNAAQKLECPAGNCEATSTDDRGMIINTTSPIQYQCQKSFIIFLTDGLANYDNDWAPVSDIINDYDADGDSGDCKYGAPGCSGQGVYFDDVAKYLHDHDLRSDLEGSQNVSTYVVGFQVNHPLLQSAARQGGGLYFTANDETELFNALQTALSDIMDKVSSGTAVATISTSSESDDELVRAKFLPISWKGFLESFAMPYSNDSVSLWEAGQLLADRPAASRNIFTRLDFTPVKKQLFSNANTNLVLYLSALWGETTGETQDVVSFIRGDNSYEGGKYRNREGWPLGDIIYSTPMAIGPPKFYFTENNYQAFKNNLRNRPRLVYVGANDGMLHAFRATDEAGADCSGIDIGTDRCAGSEQWAFVPQYLQQKLHNLTLDNCHNYYVDLSPSAMDIWDGLAWKTVLVGGARLGGEEYFCLDVTDPSPAGFSILWDQVPFPGHLSFTRPMIGKVRGGGVDKWVSILTSGYHEGNDSGKIAAINFSGGGKERIWQEGALTPDQLETGRKTGLTPYYAMTSPAAIDSDSDGYFDLIYAGDTAGTIWKFHYDYVFDIWKKTAIFHTGGQPVTAKPVIVFDDAGKLRLYFGAGKFVVGSDRFDNLRNSFYCLIDEKTVSADANNGHYTGMTVLDRDLHLLDLTEISSPALFAAMTEVQRDKVFNSGWYINLDDPAGAPAERVLEESLVVAGTVFFTSFTPNSNVCGYGGNSKLYALDYKTGLAAGKPGKQVLQEAPAGGRNLDLGPGLPSKPVFHYDAGKKAEEIIVQKSDTEVVLPSVDMPEKPMTLNSWRQTK